MPEEQHTASSHRELLSPLSTPWSHCQAAAERLWSMWFGLSVLSWKLECMYLRRGTDPANLDVPEVKILHFPKGRVLRKLHQSWTWLGKTTPGWDSGPIQEEIPNALHRRAHLCPALPSSTQEVKTKPLTFFSFLPKLSPGVPFSSTRQEMPLGPGPPVRHMTTYTSVSPPPLMKACRRAQEERGGFSHTNPERAAAAGVQRRSGKDPAPGGI